MTLRILVAATLVAVSSLSAQTAASGRLVKKNVLVSRHDPAVRIALPKQARYVGTDRWLLYGVADCEVHLFVEADKQKNVQRYYWIQFEAFVPTEPKLVYKYNSGQSLQLAGMEFDVRPRFGLSNDKPKEGSDLQHVMALLETNGYKLPAGILNVRLVHLPDAEKRKELMIIYGEDLSPTGFTAPELIPGQKGHAEWPAISKGIVERVQQRLKLKRL